MTQDAQHNIGCDSRGVTGGASLLELVHKLEKRAKDMESFAKDTLHPIRKEVNLTENEHKEKKNVIGFSPLFQEMHVQLKSVEESLERIGFYLGTLDL